MIEVLLRENFDSLLGFARKRTGDDQLAADALQESLLRAIKSEDKLAHRENLKAWFYRILRNVISDLHRREGARQRALQRFTIELETDAADETEKILCGCLSGLLPSLKPDYAEAIRRIDLGGESPGEVARTLGIKPGNVTVRLHRARRQLRKRLEQTCRMCATHGCLDCTCSPTP